MAGSRSQKLTKTDVRRIREEIEERKLVVRPAALKALKAARAMGDLSENFEYYAAKRDNNLNNSRIRYLENMLKYAEIIDDTSADDVVGMNNTVTLFFPEDNAEETYRIVTPIRSDIRRNLISNESPLGAALMGHRVNETVTVRIDETTSYDVIIKGLVNSGDSEEDRISSY